MTYIGIRYHGHIVPTDHTYSMSIERQHQRLPRANFCGHFELMHLRKLLVNNIVQWVWFEIIYWWVWFVVMSPIADLTVLTRVSTKCDYNSHLRTCAVS